MSKPVCIITSSLLISATALQAIFLFTQHPALPVISLLLTAAGTLAYLFSGQKAVSAPATTTAPHRQPTPPDTSHLPSDETRETGTVKWFNTTKGFGFISRDSGDDIFVHFRAIRGDGHRILTEGQRVEYSIIARDKGLQAEDVVDIST